MSAESVIRALEQQVSRLEWARNTWREQAEAASDHIVELKARRAMLEAALDEVLSIIEGAPAEWNHISEVVLRGRALLATEGPKSQFSPAVQAFMEGERYALGLSHTTPREGEGQTEAFVLAEHGTPILLGREVFYIHEDGGKIVLRHPRWSLVGEGTTLVDAELDLYAEARELAPILTDRARADMETMRLLDFCWKAPAPPAPTPREGEGQTDDDEMAEAEEIAVALGWIKREEPKAWPCPMCGKTGQWRPVLTCFDCGLDYGEAAPDEPAPPAPETKEEK